MRFAKNYGNWAGLIVASALLGACNSAETATTEPDQTVADSPANAQAPTVDPSSLAATASEAATFEGDRTQMLEKFAAVAAGAQELTPRLQPEMRAGLNEDVQSMQDAVEAGDMAGAQEAAASIATRLED